MASLFSGKAFGNGSRITVKIVLPTMKLCLNEAIIQESSFMFHQNLFADDENV